MDLDKKIMVFWGLSDKARPGDLAVQFKRLEEYPRWKESCYLLYVKTTTNWKEIDLCYPEFGKGMLREYGIDLDCLQSAQVKQIEVIQ